MTTKANIIIIEDEKNICSFIEHILEPQGYRVISANTGKEGLQYITSEHPDVILLDLGLTISPSHLVQESFWHVSVPLCAIPSATSILEAPNTR